MLKSDGRREGVGSTSSDVRTQAECGLLSGLSPDSRCSEEAEGTEETPPFPGEEPCGGPSLSFSLFPLHPRLPGWCPIPLLNSHFYLRSQSLSPNLKCQ